MVMISVIIPARNERSYLRNTLRSIQAQEDAPPHEVFVVDNGSLDETRDVLREFPGVWYLSEPRRGVQYARESGRRAARGNILVFLDADTHPPRHWLARGAKFFDDPRVVAASGPCIWYDAGPFLRLFSMFALDYRMGHWLVHSVLRIGAVCAGGNFFVRAAALEEIGGFDCSIGFYGDDTDIGKRLSRVGRFLYKKEITVETSARRFHQLGFVRTFALYTFHFIRVEFFRSSRPARVK